MRDGQEPLDQPHPAGQRRVQVPAEARRVRHVVEEPDGGRRRRCAGRGCSRAACRRPCGTRDTGARGSRSRGAGAACGSRGSGGSGSGGSGGSGGGPSRGGRAGERCRCSSAGAGMSRGRIVRRRAVPPESRGTGNDQRDADGQEHDARDQQPQEKRPEQLGADSRLEVHGHGGAGIGVHHHDGPAAGPDVPPEFLRAGAFGGRGPEALGRGTGGRPGAGHFVVLHPEGPQFKGPDL